MGTRRQMPGTGRMYGAPRQEGGCVGKTTVAGWTPEPQAGIRSPDCQDRSRDRRASSACRRSKSIGCRTGRLPGRTGPRSTEEVDRCRTTGRGSGGRHGNVGRTPFAGRTRWTAATSTAVYWRHRSRGRSRSRGRRSCEFEFGKHDDYPLLFS